MHASMYAKYAICAKKANYTKKNITFFLLFPSLPKKRRESFKNCLVNAVM